MMDRVDLFCSYHLRREVNENNSSSMKPPFRNGRKTLISVWVIYRRRKMKISRNHFSLFDTFFRHFVIIYDMSHYFITSSIHRGFAFDVNLRFKLCQITFKWIWNVSCKSSWSNCKTTRKNIFHFSTRQQKKQSRVEF